VSQKILNHAKIVWASDKISGPDFKWLKQNGRHMAAILFLPFEIRTNSPDF
jgi:hypothetical protein